MTTFDKRAIVAAAAMLAIGTAYAQTTSPAQPGQAPQTQSQKGFTGELRSGPWGDESFMRLDTNRDGMLSREEAAADPMVRDAWSKLDPRNAGRVSRADFDKYGTSQPPSNTAPNLNSGGPAPAPATTPKQ